MKNVYLLFCEAGNNLVIHQLSFLRCHDYTFSHIVLMFKQFPTQLKKIICIIPAAGVFLRERSDMKIFMSYLACTVLHKNKIFFIDLDFLSCTFSLRHCAECSLCSVQYTSIEYTVQGVVVHSFPAFIVESSSFVIRVFNSNEPHPPSLVNFSLLLT